MKITHSMGNELVNFGAYSADNLRDLFSYDDTFPVDSDRYEMMTWWEACYLRIGRWHNMAKQSKSRYVMIDNTGRIWIDSDLTPNRLKTLVRELERFGVYVHESTWHKQGLSA